MGGWWRRPGDSIACILSRARHSFKPAWLVHLLSRSRVDDVEEGQGGQGQWLIGLFSWLEQMPKQISAFALTGTATGTEPRRSRS